jgi:hypothetical protein
MIDVGKGIKRSDFYLIYSPIHAIGVVLHLYSVRPHCIFSDNNTTSSVIIWYLQDKFKHFDVSLLGFLHFEW